MTGALLDRPATLIEARDGEAGAAGGGRLTLEALLGATLRAAQTSGDAECPVCHARMAPTPAGAECAGCGSRLT